MRFPLSMPTSLSKGNDGSVMPYTQVEFNRIG